MIYKYFSDTSRHAVENFRNGQICFSHVDSFNDCNEFSARFGEDLRLPDGIDLSQDIVNGFKLRCRICCFSRSSELENMWGYYANGGRGFCLGFNEDMIKEMANVVLLPVIYSSSPVVLKEGTQKEQDEMFIQQLTHKATEWCCEQEVRAIYTVPNDRIEQISLSQNLINDLLVKNDCQMVPGNNPLTPFSVLKRSILLTLPAERLIIGKRCSQKLQNELCSIATQKSIPVEYMKDHP